jgi:DNA-binding LacI/PurR family transcriptional regulator
MVRQRPTLEQVAGRAGVSRASVSRVVNGSTTVTPEIRDRVIRVVNELGYVPNQAARSLVTQRTGLFAMVLPEPSTRVFSDDQFLPALVRAGSQEVQAAGGQLVLMTAGPPAGDDRLERYLKAGHVDGAVVVPKDGVDPLPAALSRAGVPVVTNGRPLGPSSVPYVDVDSANGVAAAVRYLVTAGRTRIATIAGPQDLVAGVDRLAAYRAELAGCDRRSIVAVGDFTRESGEAAMRQLLAADPDIDAVFVASDLMAHGAIHALRRAGRRVPHDIAVIGFDDIELTRYIDPPLTTVRQSTVDLGCTLVRQLVRMASGEQIEPAVILPTSLVLRESA